MEGVEGSQENAATARKTKAKRGKASEPKRNEIPPPGPSPQEAEAPKLPKDEKEPELPLLGSREAEKNLLILLNKRLEKIIEKNRQLQAINSNLMSQLHLEKQASSAKVVEVTTKASGDLDKARDELTKTKKELVQMTFKLGAVGDEVEELKGRLANAVDETGRQKRQINELESELSKLTSALKKEMWDKAKSDQELRQWKEEAIKLGQVLQETKTELEKEILAKLQLEQNLTGEIDEKVLKTTLIETELFQFKASTKKMLDDINEQRQKEFENALERSMSALRDEYNAKLAENKEEQSRLYDEKEKDHISKKETLSSALQRKTKELEVALSEGKTLKEGVRKLEAERHALIVQLDDLEQERQRVVEELSKELEERDKALEEKRKEHGELVSRVQHLLDIKVALDNELSAYKSLLETEEKRLELGVRMDENDNLTT